jgi:hypothetical protein
MANSAARRFLFSIDDLAAARGAERELSFTGGGPDAFAAALQTALREPALWQQWLDRQSDPDEVDKTLGATDPAARVTAEQHDLRTDVTATTTLSHAILRHRLNLLIGSNWALQDVRSA